MDSGSETAIGPLRDPLGFSQADYIQLYLAVALVLLAILWRPLLPVVRRLAVRSVWSMLLLAILPVALRLALLPNHPIPVPDIYDEFGHLFVADTLRHFRLANPPHPLHQFFETFFRLQQPTYSSIYPLGQGLMLATGWTLFGLPWAGVLLSTAALCSLCYWMLRAWTTPSWALFGGLLAVFEFGPLCIWMNDYWGGSLAASAGCLVFGALPRLLGSHQRRYAIPLAVGLAIHILVRPFESIALLLCVALYLAPMWREIAAKKALLRSAPLIAAGVVAAFGITLAQNKAVTGSWTTLPYQLSQYQYGVPAALTFQTNPVPHAQLTREQELGYKSQLAFRSSAPETLRSYWTRFKYRVRYYRFFFLPPLYLAIAAFVLTMFRWRFLWVAFTLAMFAAITNFFPAFQLHYVAAAACLFVLVSVIGLQRIGRWRPEAAQVLIFLCIAYFAFWYAMSAANAEENAPRRRLVNQEVARIPGQALIFVRYWPQHIFQEEWVYNEADIDHARIVWARDLGEPENEKLRRYYPGRSVWLLEADARPPRLGPYEVPKPQPPPPPVSTAMPPAPPRTAQPTLRFEDVPR